MELNAFEHSTSWWRQIEVANGERKAVHGMKTEKEVTNHKNSKKNGTEFLK